MANLFKEELPGYPGYDVTFQAINAEVNKELLEKVPHITMCDLALICLLIKESSDGGICSAVLTNRLLQRLGLSKEEIFTEKRLGTNTSLDFEVLNFAFGTPFVLHVVTNQTKINGAACIFFPSVLEEARKKLGYDFYIIPSSIHEILLIEKNLTEAEECKKLIRKINQEFVAEDEILSYNLYEFVKGKVSIV